MTCFDTYFVERLVGYLMLPVMAVVGANGLEHFVFSEAAPRCQDYGPCDVARRFVCRPSASRLFILLFALFVGERCSPAHVGIR